MKSPFKNISLRLQILKVNIKIHFIRFKMFLNILKMLSISLKMKWNIVKMKMKKVYVNAYFTIVPPLKFIFIFPAIVLSGIVVLPIIISNLNLPNCLLNCSSDKVSESAQHMFGSAS